MIIIVMRLIPLNRESRHPVYKKYQFKDLILIVMPLFTRKVKEMYLFIYLFYASSLIT